MARCDWCGKNTYLPYKCRYCGGFFCEDCRLPPNHDCKNIEDWKTPPAISQTGRSEGMYRYAKTHWIQAKRSRRSGKLKKIAAFIFVFLIGVLAYNVFEDSNTGYLDKIQVFREVAKISHLGETETSPTPVSEDGTEVSPSTPVSEEKTQSKNQLGTGEEIINKTVNQVLNYLNEERKKRELPPVELMQTGIAQFRAEDMIQRDYFGHYDPEGFPPFHYYTKMGGIYAMEENCGYYRVIGGSTRYNEIPDKVVDSVRRMIYNDSLSDWGHRDSLLDPGNNFVDIGVSWDSDEMVLVIHMIKKHVEWINPPEVENMLFSAAGKIDRNVEFYGVLVYYHPPPSKEFTNRHSYELGDVVAGVIPSPYYYKDVETWRPVKWRQTDHEFDISFRIKPVKGEGFYTVVIFVKNKSGLKHPYDPERNDYWSILDYTVYVKTEE
ncbi:Uncharacterized protein with SCP/PR1 domains [Archaeoglobus sulfaticallidus PM70-1]|uniref:Uncharacterized protein with SCP/PR1 domains n=1 Tax=Archaeoglobus sulfaticallidus PM70-1 TaxID=387631 RepID=N0BM87_9EURY|nr:AN1-type zinc finger domain-containing protein [Archaeoglobus sulfaticallidus]AGK61385.1 Uncharacterized protein with SCP/PR1 domains [Archaeoglobus sulfaticallidus PM70-1]